MSQLSKVASMLSGDTAFLLVCFVVIMGVAFYLGRGFLISLIISFYPASLLYKSFPFLEKAIVLSGENLIVINKIGVFIVFLVPIAIVLNRFIFSASEYGRGDNILKLAGLSVAFLILVVLFSYNTVSYDALHDFSPQIDAIFGVEERQFYWYLAPIALMGVL